jgi:hypothetical protein
MKGLEPSTFCMASRRSSQLSYIRKKAQYSLAKEAREDLGERLPVPVPVRSRPLSLPSGATWRSGYAEACKAFHTGSIPVVASSFVSGLELDGAALRPRTADGPPS